MGEDKFIISLEPVKAAQLSDFKNKGVLIHTMCYY